MRRGSLVKAGGLTVFFVLILLPFAPYVLVTRGAEQAGSGMPALVKAGRKVMENSGCLECHTRYIRLIPEELVRYFPGTYFKVDLEKLKRRVYTDPVDLAGYRTGPDIEVLPFSLYGDEYIRGYISEPQRYNAHSLMPAYKKIFNEKLRSDEIVFAFGSREFSKGYPMTSRGEALINYLRYSSGSSGGNN